MWLNPQSPVNLATFTDEILNKELHFLCSDLENETPFHVYQQSKIEEKINST